MITIVSDTSPLVAFACLGLETLIPKLLGVVYISPVVAAEVASPRFGFGGITADRLPGVLVRAPSDPDAAVRFANEVDAGEAESIALALEMKADLIIVDDAAARDLAVRIGFTITGTVGLLLRAKRDGHVAQVKPLLDRLRSDIRFFLSQSLYERALMAAGE